MARKKAELSALSKRFSNFKRAAEVLETVKAVPTIFPAFDHAVKIGGWPIARMALVHGPSGNGKSVYCLGLAASFLVRGHLVLWVDAERTTPIEWAEEMIGDEARGERFFAVRPPSYEATVDAVREFVRTLKSARDAGELPPETSALVVVDSIRKLVPEDILKKITKQGASGADGSVDGMGGRAAQIRAAMNAAWMDELIPLLDETQTAFLAIARESEDPNADIWAKKFGNDYKIGGGKALFYDASLVVRIEHGGYVQEEIDGKKFIRGEKHKVVIRKTKVAGKEDRTAVGFFHTSNGTAYPLGFDRTKDVFELALKLEVLKADGSKITWPSRDPEKRIGRSAASALQAFRDADGDLAMLEDECRAKFASVEPEEEKP